VISLTTYGHLYAEERKAERLATLIDVVRMEIPQDTPEEIKAKIPEYATEVVNAGPTDS